MASFRVAITDQGFPDLDAERRELAAVGAEIVAGQCRTEDEVLALAQGADAILCDASPITRRVLAGLPRLRVVSEYGIGVDNVDLAAASELGVWVANVPGFCTAEVADHTMALLLAAARRVVLHDRSVRAGGWGPADAFGPVERLSDQALGLIGFGRIGSAVARRARGFGLRVLAYDPAIPDAAVREQGAQPADLETLLAEADYVSLHLPATPQTRGLLSARHIALMKPGAWLINTARGALVDEEALADALRSGRLAGAALDVRRAEPPGPLDPLRDLPNVILTPHCAYYSRRSLAELQLAAARNVVAVLRGGAPATPVNPGIAPRRIP